MVNAYILKNLEPFNVKIQTTKTEIKVIEGMHQIRQTK
jgi:hypothetical protein